MCTARIVSSGRAKEGGMPDARRSFTDRSSQTMRWRVLSIEDRLTDSGSESPESDDVAAIAGRD